MMRGVAHWAVAVRAPAPTEGVGAGDRPDATSAGPIDVQSFVLARTDVRGGSGGCR